MPRRHRLTAILTAAMLVTSAACSHEKVTPQLKPSEAAPATSKPDSATGDPVTATTTASGTGDKSDGGAKGSVPASLVGSWDTSPSGGLLSYTFNNDGTYSWLGTSSGVGGTCSGVAIASGSSLQLIPRSPCARQTVSWSIDGNTLHVGSTRYYRRGIPANSAQCLLGKWEVSLQRAEDNSANWGLGSGTVTTESLDDSSGHTGKTLRFGGDGTETETFNNFTMYAPGTTSTVRWVSNGTTHAHYSVSGGMIHYSSPGGSVTFTVYQDGANIGSTTPPTTYTDDHFTCGQMQAELTGTDYLISMWRQ